MPHYEQLKCRNNHISLRSHNSGGDSSTGSINLFKPIMIALAVILFFSLLFALLKYYSPIVQLNVRNFMKRDKESARGIELGALSSTNLTQGFLNSFESFKFSIQDDENSNKRFSIDTIDLGNNKYSASLQETNTSNDSGKSGEENIYSLTRSSIEPFFNNYTNYSNTNESGIPFSKADNSNTQLPKGSGIKDFSFSWNNAFNWVKSKDNLLKESLITNNILNTNQNIDNTNEKKLSTSNNFISNISASTKLESTNELESDYFNPVLKPRKSKVIVNTMKPAVTPNKYRDEEYYSNNNMSLAEVKYDTPYYDADSKPAVKKKTVKVEERYSSLDFDTNKKPVVINRETPKKENSESTTKKYNTNYYVESKEKNIIVVNEKEKKLPTRAKNISQAKTSDKIVDTYIPSEEYRKVVEYRLETIKKESINPEAKKKYTTVITNKNELPKEIKKDLEYNKKVSDDLYKKPNSIYTEEIHKNTMPSIETLPITKNDTIKKDDNISSITRAGDTKATVGNSDGNSLLKNNNIEREIATENIIYPEDKKIENPKSYSTRVRKPENKNYIYLVSFDGNNGEISLVRKERKFGDSSIKTILDTLLKGANDRENSEDVFSAISKDTKLLDVYIDFDTLYLNFSDDFEYNPLGSEGMMLAIYQIVYTVTQFENIDNVIFLIDGKFNETIGSEGLIINKIFTRLESEKYLLDINRDTNLSY